MNLRNRIKQLESEQAERGESVTEAMFRQGWEAWVCKVGEFLELVPPDLQDSLVRLIATEEGKERLSGWVSSPFVRWATVPPGFMLPRPLVEFVLNPPRRFWFGHACERCGLQVPLFSTHAGDPNPPANVRTFPECPHCGGPTSFAATYQTGPKTSEDKP
jgi:hypothetical protein